MTIETRLNPGERCVFLRAGGGDGTVQLLAFVAAGRSGLEVWQTPDERRVPPRRTGTYPEPFEPLRIARLLASCWDGQDLAIAGLTPRKRAKLGLDVNGRIGRYRVRATYLSAIEAYGWDFDQGAGWYLVVLNPSDSWRFNDPAGPYLSPEDAFGDASFLAEQE